MAATAKAKSRKKAEDLAVPVLDKGDYNNEKTLCYFLQQEEIAKKMIEEAKRFYDSFLSSKTVTFRQILFDYPKVPLVQVDFRVYYTDVKISKRGCGTCLNYLPDGKKSKLRIYPRFYIDAGDVSFGRFRNEFYSYERFGYGFMRRIEDCAETVRQKEKGNERKWKTEGFKDPKVVEATYKRYEALNEEISKANSIADFYIEIPEEEFMSYIDIDEVKRRNADASVYDYEDEFDHERTKSACDSKKYGGQIGFCYASCTNPEHYDETVENWYGQIEIYPRAFEFIKLPESLADRIRELQEKFTQDFRDIVKALINQCKDKEPSFLDCQFLFKKDGRLVELITNEIKSTDLNKKTGQYTISCAEDEEKHPEYCWPSDCDLICTTYHQVFVFDIASNDLIDYYMPTSTRRESRKRRY
ncbi:MAG: hypothetical protein IKS60_08415 [Lachnospiraceae bacterium]|nr:hypothetical protein [Lachnospiraceae bacterium]